MQKVEKILFYIKKNRIYEAQKMLIKNFKNKPGHFYYYLGLINIKREDYISALVCFKTARKNNVNSHLLSYNLSICYFNFNKYDSAKKELIEAIKKNPLFYDSYINLCNIYIKEKKYKEAFRTIKYGQASLKNEKYKIDKLLYIEEKLLLSGFIK